MTDSFLLVLALKMISLREQRLQELLRIFHNFEKKMYFDSSAEPFQTRGPIASITLHLALLCRHDYDLSKKF